jgi:hypothetical protein
VPASARRLLTIAIAPLTALTLMSAIACGGDSGSPTGPSSSSASGAATPPPVSVQCPAPYKAGSISATVDNSSWQATCSYALRSTSSIGTVVSVSGTDLGNPQRIVTFAFLGATPGTYSLESTIVSTGNASFVGGTGTVTVTTLTTTSVAGTFSFTGSGQAGGGTVRNGTFNVTF